jgi:hypothetical protein
MSFLSQRTKPAATAKKAEPQKTVGLRSMNLRGFLAGCILILLVTACQTKTPTETPIPTPSETPTDTPTVTVTVTRTLRPTVTHIPSHTPTITQTPFPSPSPTPTETIAPLQPAQLFTFYDAEGTLVDWSYSRLASLLLNQRTGQVKSLAAFMAFQLIDRSIHRMTTKAFSREMTVYYLNVQHQFGSAMQPMMLVIGATYGSDVTVKDIPAGGSSYVLVRHMVYWEGFDALGIHGEVSQPASQRSSKYQLMPLLDLQSFLPALPEKMIVLADHPVLVDPDGYQQLYNDMSSVSYLAARYLPFIQLDEYDRITGPTTAALALEEYFIYHMVPSVSIPSYSSEVLVLLTPP